MGPDTRPDELSERPTPVANLLAAGWPKWKLYGPERDHPIQGVVARRTQPSNHRGQRDTQIWALRVMLRPGQFFSRRTAAKLHGLPTAPIRRADRVEVGAVTPVRAPRRPQVRGHQLRDGTLAIMPRAPDWLPSIEDTWCLLAQVASKAELLAAGDFIVSGATRYDEPLSTIAALRVAAARFSGSSGSQLRSTVLKLIRAGVESAAESELRLIIVSASIAEPVIQCPVPCGQRTLHADLGYPELKIAIEYEGAYHFAENAVEQGRRDVLRVRDMEAAGWKVLRVTVHDLRDPGPFLVLLRSTMRERSRSR